MEYVQSDILDGIDKYKPNMAYEDSVIDGYKTIYDTTVSRIFNSSIGQVELLFMNSDGDGKIGITAAIQHPFSHGRVYIKSSDPMENPIIDPNYLSNPAGKIVMFRIIMRVTNPLRRLQDAGRWPQTRSKGR